MTAKWEDRTLGDISDQVGGIVQTGPFGSQLHESDYSVMGVPVIMPKNIIEGTISTTGIARVSPEHVDRLSKHQLKAGDIVYGRRGDIGRQALIRPEQEGWLCGTGCLRVSLGSSVIEPLFLHYYLRQEDVIGWVANQAIGATLPNLNTAILRSVPVRIPPLPVQHRIASILSAYDDLIENNQRRIKILEDMARSLYREWFVDFRFPGHESVQLVNSTLGQIPEGWDACTFGGLYNTSSGGTPSRKIQEYYKGTIPWIKTRELNDGFIFDSEETISDLGLSKSSAKMFPKDSVIIAIYGATIGKLGILSQPSATNQACVAILPKERGFGRSFAFFTLIENRAELINLGQGAAQQNISQVVIKSFPVVKPPSSLVSEFERSASPIHDAVRTYQQQILLLRTTRDLLLPRLLSGQIDVSKVEEEQETAA
jgi:type I restriction enzyme S subunit